MSDLSIIYASAHKIPEYFAANVLRQLYRAAGDIPVHEIHTTPEKSSITNYYRELIATAKTLKTPYIAFAEDDTLYPDEHFNHRPKTFAYNFNRWNIFTWSQPPFFSLCRRMILGTLIAPREEFIEIMSERIKLPESQMVEPGRRDGEPSEVFETYNPIVVFSHPDSYGYGTKRKKAGKIRALEIPRWGTAEDVMDAYENTPKPNN